MNVGRLLRLWVWYTTRAIDSRRRSWFGGWPIRLEEYWIISRFAGSHLYLLVYILCDGLLVVHVSGSRDVGFRVQGVGFRVHGVGFRVGGLGFRV